MSMIRLLSLLLFACSLQAAELPAVPPSDKVLTPDQVKNYWINTIPKLKLPDKSNGLHPDRQRHRENLIQQRKSLISEVKKGSLNVEAKLASLTHNVNAYTNLGDDEKAKLTEERLFALREHLATLATLKVQRDAARKLSEAADRISELESEISSLQQSINQETCSNTCD